MGAKIEVQFPPWYEDDTSKKPTAYLEFVVNKGERNDEILDYLAAKLELAKRKKDEIKFREMYPTRKEQAK